MRAFAAKQNQPHKTNDLTTSSLAKPVQRLESDHELPFTASAFGHDFSRIPLHAKAPETIQPTLATSTPGDMYAQETDHLAEPIMFAPEKQQATLEPPGSLKADCLLSSQIQRKSLQLSDPTDADEREADEVAREVVSIPSAQRIRIGAAVNGNRGGSKEITGEFQSRLESSKGAGRSLDGSTRIRMESKMGADFSRVKVHTDNDAHSMNDTIDSKAFTHGQNIYFRQSEYRPESEQGTLLLAHELVHAAHNQNGQMIKREFDKETATQRIKGTKTINEFRLVDANGIQIKYDTDDIAKGFVYLPEGTLVSKLDPNPRNPNYVHVIAWHNMKYRDGYIHKSAFSGEYEGGSLFDVEVFIDDAYHTVHRAKLLLRRKPPEDKATQHLRTMLSDVEAQLRSFKEGKIQITSDMLEKIREKDQKTLAIDQSNKPETVNRLSSAISEATNPLTSEGSKLSDTVLYVPLSDTWFQSDEKLKEHYEKVIVSSANFNRFVGKSGEGIENAPAFIEGWFDEFAMLRNMISGRPVGDSPEGKWLKTITPDVQKRTKRMIFISGATWPSMAEPSSRYAEFVAVSTSFGPVQANPLMLLLMHELNVNTSAGVSLMGEDSHIPPEDTKSAWESANKGDFSKTIANDSDRLDDLFQAQSGIALTVLSRYFKKIEAMQKSAGSDE